MQGFHSGEGLHLCPANHAEANCLFTAAKEGIRVEGCSMYMTCGIPCKSCLGGILNAGIKEIIVTSLDLYDDLSARLLQESGLIVRTYE